MVLALFVIFSGCTRDNNLVSSNQPSRPTTTILTRTVNNTYDWVGQEHNKALDYFHTEMLAKQTNRIKMSPAEFGDFFKTTFSVYLERELNDPVPEEKIRNGLDLVQQIVAGKSFDQLVDQTTYSMLEKSLLKELFDLIKNLPSVELLDAALDDFNEKCYSILGPDPSPVLLSASSIAKHSGEYWLNNDWSQVTFAIVDTTGFNNPYTGDCSINVVIASDIVGGIFGGLEGAVVASAGYTFFCVIVSILNYFF